MKTVTVFGSSFPAPQDEEYLTAYELGKFLALSKLNVCTGGYQGIMDAVSRGAVENGSEAVGVTLESIHGNTSGYLTKEIRAANLLERIQILIDTGDAYVVLRGGTGTMVEMAVVWEYMNKSIIGIKPLACHGRMWDGIIEIINSRMKYEGRRTDLIKCFDSISDCAGYIVKSLGINR